MKSSRRRFLPQRVPIANKSKDGMLLPPLCTAADYVSLATSAGLTVLAEPKDISKDVSKTW